MKNLKQNLRTPWGTAAAASFICGVVTHGFALVNVLHNCDDIAQQPIGYGTGITSGRWLLTVLGDFVSFWGGNYNLPLVNGLLFLLLLAAAAGFAVSALGIRKRRLAALTGMLFAVFPSVTATMLFRYTVVYYGIAVLLAVLAAWVLPRGRWGLPLSALCVALSLGLYQAYVPMTISLFVLILLRQTLEGRTEVPALVRKGLYDCAALVLGLLLYYLLLKLLLAVYDTSLSDYQGVDSMGKLSLAELPGLLKEAVYYVCMLPFKNYCGLAGMRLLKLLYLAIFVLSAAMALLLLLRQRKPGLAVMTVLLGIVFPVAVNFIVIMCPEGWIYTLMVYPFVMIPLVPAVLADLLPVSEAPWKQVRAGASVLLALMVLCYAYEANVNYSTVYYATRQVENYANALVIQVRMTEGFDTEKEWAFLGDVDDPLMNCFWQYEIRYDGSEFTQPLLNHTSRRDWIQNYTGYLPPLASEETIAQLCKTEEVRQMPCWPDQGSIKVIGNTVVIKFQELS